MSYSYAAYRLRLRITVLRGSRLLAPSGRGITASSLSYAAYLRPPPPPALARNSLRELFSFPVEREMTATLSVSHCLGLAAAAWKEGRKEGRKDGRPLALRVRPSPRGFVLIPRVTVLSLRREIGSADVL